MGDEAKHDRSVEAFQTRARNAARVAGTSPDALVLTEPHLAVALEKRDVAVWVLFGERFEPTTYHAAPKTKKCPPRSLSIVSNSS
jgi:hypothetical protein